MARAWQCPRYLAAVALLLMAFLSAPTKSEEAPVRIAMTTTADLDRSGMYVWLRAFADVLEGGGLTVHIYPSSALGNEIVRTEQLALGLLAVNGTGTQEVSMHSPLFKVIDLPFVFADIHHLDRLLTQTDFIERVNREITPYGLRFVDAAPLGGMSGLFTARKPVHRLEDLATMRIRAMEQIQLKMLAAWGSGGTQVAWEEVSQALQTGIADGYMNPPLVPVMFGHSGQLDYFTELATSPSFRAVVISEPWYRALPAARRELVDRAITVARTVSRAWNEKIIVKEMDMLRSIGIQIITLAPEERARFRERTIDIYPEIIPGPGLDGYLELVDSVR